ncbi:hypothetical protein RHGRI_013558 [Rhododendron griersonianum]|uniref:phenylalanine--tRNA ligase n=1 Tax=Rhododendron griersonianum TaxID=479676 RepID=A0AAV6K610_9ERIC|nr:hypothetical protein RHGRI_013558 [Rhododendron griersonianum]
MAEEAVLGFLEKNEEITDSGQFAAERGIDHQDIANIIKSLHGFKLVDAQDIKRESWVLTEEGKTYAAAGSPEVQVFLAVPPEGISLDELQRKMDPTVFKIGRSQAIKNQWVEMGKQLTRKVQDVDDKVKDLLIRIQDGEVVDPKEIDALKRRKLISPQPWKGYSVRKGPKYAPRRKKFATDLTRENILRGDWKDLEFKEYNFSAKGQPVGGGSLHPLLKITRFAFHMKTAKIIAKAIVVIYILVIAGHCATANQDDFPADGVRYNHCPVMHIPQEEGECKVLDFWSWALVFAYRFEEMPTNNFVESSFWNFDALFQPQQHPARDSHDTFFLQVPSTTKMLPEDYVERVKHVHEFGGYGSRGYGYEWKREEANKNLLRTHTTAVSSRMLYSLAQKDFVPKKYFSIDRVFRNEAVDRTHLAEFHQIEGLVCDRNLSLGHLIGVLNDFFSRLGMSKLKFKPAYNPYTEPSMEIFSYHEGLEKWVEIGNSGMFRPEMLRPMGLPADVRVIAWGLSLERPTMILYGVDNIRDLFGPKVDLSLIKKNPLCRIGI